MKNLFSLLISFLVVACSTTNKHNVNIVEFETPTHESLFSVGLLNVAGAVTLHGEGSPIISPDSKVIIHNGVMHFFDKQTMVVSRFDSHGKFINSVGIVGRGPGEYIRADDFCIDINNGDIEYLSLTEQNISKYSSSGGFIANQKIPGYPYSFTKYPNGYYLFCKGPVDDTDSTIGKAQLYLTDGDGNVKKTYLPVEENNALPGPAFDESIQVSNGRVFFKTWFTGDIHLITQENAELVLTVDFKGRAYEKNILEKSTEDFMTFLQSINPYNIDRYLESDQYLYMYVADAMFEKFAHIVYNKKTKAIKIIDDSPGDDQEKMRTGSAKAITEENELLFIVDPNVAQRIVDIPNLTENSNSVILRGRICL